MQNTEKDTWTQGHMKGLKLKADKELMGKEENMKQDI